jgi:hypothetical protein
MAIPLHRASAFGLWTEQSPAAQSEADIGAPVTRSAPRTQISLRPERALCFRQFMSFIANPNHIIDKPIEASL